MKNEFPSDSQNLVNGGAYTATDNDASGINAGDWYQISAHENNLSLLADEGDTLKSLIENEYNNNSLPAW